MAESSSSGGVDKLLFDKHGNHDEDDRDNSTKKELLKLGDYFHRMVQINSTKRKGADAGTTFTPEGIERFQACVTGFTHFITSNAEQRCNAENREIVTGDDVLYAMDTAGFKQYMEYLNQWLRKYGEASYVNQEGGKEEGGTGPEFIAAEYMLPPTLSADGKWEPEDSAIPANIVSRGNAPKIEDLEVLWTPWVSEPIANLPGWDFNAFLSLNAERLLPTPPPEFNPASSAFNQARAPQ